MGTEARVYIDEIVKENDRLKKELRDTQDALERVENKVIDIVGKYDKIKVFEGILDNISDEWTFTSKNKPLLTTITAIAINLYGKKANAYAKGLTETARTRASIYVDTLIENALEYLFKDNVRVHDMIKRQKIKSISTEVEKELEEKE